MDLVRVLRPAGADDLRGREWLVANGLGGYAAGPVAGPPTRRYHGLLISSLPAPLGRTMMLNAVGETALRPDGGRLDFSCEAGGLCTLAEFRLEWGLPVWRFQAGEMVVEKRIVMPHQQNTTIVEYRLVEGPAATLTLVPWFHFRGHDHPVDTELPGRKTVQAEDGRFEIRLSGLPPVRLRLSGTQSRFVLNHGTDIEHIYTHEGDRGYASRGRLWSPGALEAILEPDHPVSLMASTERWHVAQALSASEAWEYETQRRRRLVAAADPSLRQGMAAELVIAADSFVIAPVSRVAEQARARSHGEDVRAVIAGYHWFAVWGRDTMISLEGLTLATGRREEARWILSTFAQHVKDGLIPNYFPDHEVLGHYHTADATLWFFHAIDRYVTATGDDELLERLLPALVDILDRHRKGTRFGIGVDPADGLLRQGSEGFQLTWMDAKVEDWVVTPRRGKAVEINALWANALTLMAGWLNRAGDTEAARDMTAEADRVREAFNRRFWNPATGFLFDVVDGEDGDDPACRPNQIFAIALPHPVLEEQYWASVVEAVRERLLTPVGLRSLSPEHPDYKARYFGNLRARDAAYHQGTVWGWLVGPWVDAWLRTHPGDNAAARRCLESFRDHMDEFGIGTIAEIFDAEAPFTPRGCISQAWSVAEWLRAWVKAAGDEGGPGVGPGVG